MKIRLAFLAFLVCVGLWGLAEGATVLANQLSQKLDATTRAMRINAVSEQQFKNLGFGTEQQSVTFQLGLPDLEVEYAGRKCLTYPTERGNLADRYRLCFLDGRLEWKERIS